MFEKFGVMIDCSRNSVMNLPALKKLIDLLSAMGYNTMQLYTEDTYEVNGEPLFGYLRGRYSKVELKEIDRYAAAKGIELIPCIQTLAHMGQIFRRFEEYVPINDCNDILFAGEERTYRLIDNIFATLAECFTSRNVNIGMDEAFMLGLGKYLDKNGFQNRSDIMLSHLSRIIEIARKYGFTCAMWSDMFFRLAFGGKYQDADGEIPDEIRQKIPADVKLIYWDYNNTDKKHYDMMIRRHKKLGNQITFAGGALTWFGLAPLNALSIEATRQAFTACRENGIGDVILTMWGDNGGSCSPFSVLPALFAAAEFARGEKNMATVKRKFKELTGVSFDVFLYADLPNVIEDGQKPKIANPCKYLFYNDPLLGYFDATVDESAGAVFTSHAAKLKRAEKYKEWTFLFKPLRLLCEALSIKAALGLKTRNAYLAGDKAALQTLIGKEYKPLLKKIDVFYNAFAGYWDVLFKPHGFDVMDIRIGGLIQRLKHAIIKLQAYISGEAASIPELDEARLDSFGLGGKGNVGLYANLYNQIATINAL